MHQLQLLADAPCASKLATWADAKSAPSPFSPPAMPAPVALLQRAFPRGGQFGFLQLQLTIVQLPEEIAHFHGVSGAHEALPELPVKGRRHDLLHRGRNAAIRPDPVMKWTHQSRMPIAAAAPATQRTRRRRRGWPSATRAARQRARDSGAPGPVVRKSTGMNGAAASATRRGRRIGRHAPLRSATAPRAGAGAAA